MLTVEFTLMGIPCIGLNGGAGVEHNWAFSFQVATEDQSETDRYWNAIVGNGGEVSQCGWRKDKWGVSWADYAACFDKSVHRPGPCRRQTCLRRDDDDAEDRHREN
ncbi:3-demethylubiquinone-9 3-methyltransferase [Rosistilla ulvae]|uniref:3-demethylubiquinone-9 3-methyltransferase n=1 Tax=Rosistilla ulvae TaxID=1930277 RepID=A0A517M745_9BACT|nr:3-demethylubiquinone-9 3-methyltransferase [Rosistilla ulvae]